MHTSSIISIALLLYIAIYFLPTIVAFLTHHKNKLSIFFLNLLLGWTFIGWVIALVWAAKRD